jgi:hypothetical protein
MLSAAGLTTSTCTEPPARATAGVIVNSTGSGPVPSLTVDVETPQAWRVSATAASLATAGKTLPFRRFMITAGVRIERSFPAEGEMGELGGNQRTSAHVVALCPVRMRKEHTSGGTRFFLGMAVRSCTTVSLLYASTDEAARVIGATSLSLPVR